MTERIEQAIVRHGLSKENGVDPEVYGFFMDSMEVYMKELVNKTVQKARIRLQDSHVTLGQAIVGDQMVLRNISYSVQDKRDLLI